MFYINNEGRRTLNKLLTPVIVLFRNQLSMRQQYERTFFNFIQLHTWYCGAPKVLQCSAFPFQNCCCSLETKSVAMINSPPSYTQRPKRKKILKFLLCLLSWKGDFIFIHFYVCFKYLFSFSIAWARHELREWMKNVFIYRKKHKVGTKIYYAAAFALIFYVNEQWRICLPLFLHCCCFLFLMTHSHQLEAIFCALFCPIKL